MAGTTIERIQGLARERLRLYMRAADGHGDERVCGRIGAITRELDRLWRERRRERVGQRDGIDWLTARSYARLYGEMDLICPPRPEATAVGEALGEKAVRPG